VAARAGWAAADLARAYMDGGARLIQVRAKNLPSGQLLEVCDRVVQDAHACGAAVIVNDRVDVARL
jgi:thiamine monophosphate synthase